MSDLDPWETLVSSPRKEPPMTEAEWLKTCEHFEKLRQTPSPAECHRCGKPRKLFVAAGRTTIYFDCEHCKGAPMVAPAPETIQDPPMPSSVATVLGQQLKSARLAAGLSRADAAGLAGVTETRWGQMERGSVSNLNKLQSACEAIGAVLKVSVEVPSEEE